MNPSVSVTIPTTPDIATSMTPKALATNVMATRVPRSSMTRPSRGSANAPARVPTR